MFDPATPLIEIAPGLAMPGGGGVQSNDRDYDVHVIIELRKGRYRCRELRVLQRDGGPEVTSEALRSIPVANLVKQGVLSMTKGATTLRPPDTITQHGPTPEALEWVARIYRLAYAVGDPPRHAVSTALNLPASTAARWIARAREAGQLGPAESLGKAGV